MELFMEIMLNKSFVGSWGDEQHEENIPHEIINRFRSDNGKIYIYVPPYGGFKTKDHTEIESILITSNCSRGKTEILYAVTGLTLLHQGGKEATQADREELEKIIIRDNIKYGGKYLHEIKMSETTENDYIFYMTFEVEKIVRPKKRMFITWNSEENELHDDEQDIFRMPISYNYSRQYGFLYRDNYKFINQIISDNNYWEEECIVKTIEAQDLTRNNDDYNFLKLIHKEDDETIYTNLFYEFFNKNPMLFNKFAKEVLKINTDDNYKKIKKESTTNNEGSPRGRIDLLAEGENNVIVIENKLKSGLNGKDKERSLTQLTTYIEFIEHEYPNMNRYYFLFEPAYNEIDISRFDTNRGLEFKKIKYNEIYNFFCNHQSELEKIPECGSYAKDFIKALKKHTLTMYDIVELRFIKAIHSKEPCTH